MLDIFNNKSLKKFKTIVTTDAFYNLTPGNALYLGNALLAYCAANRLKGRDETCMVFHNTYTCKYFANMILGADDQFDDTECGEYPCRLMIHPDDDEVQISVAYDKNNPNDIVGFVKYVIDDYILSDSKIVPDAIFKGVLRDPAIKKIIKETSVAVSVKV